MSDICDVLSSHEPVVDALRHEMPDEAVFSASAAFFKALSDPTRTKIIWALDRAELCVCDLAALLSMTQSAVSHQLAGLRKDRMVVARRAGKEVFYSLADDHIRTMLESGMAHTKE